MREGESAKLEQTRRGLLNRGMSEEVRGSQACFKPYSCTSFSWCLPSRSWTRAKANSCKRKDIIIDKFDQLLRKLGGTGELSLKISLGRIGAEWHAAMAGWLDSESTYRLRIEQVDSKTYLLPRVCMQ
jgi:hypothetical protein